MSDLLNRATEYVSNIILQKLPKGMVYHNLDHTKEVVETTEEIGRSSGISNSELEILLLAAWFHDTGITEVYNNHEEKSAEIAKEFLLRNNYPLEKSEKVYNLILVTKMPQSPKNLLEQIICDADISHIGRKGFNTRSQLLRAEWEILQNNKISDIDWLKNNIEFVAGNKFYTKYAKENFEEQRLTNLAKLQKKLRKEVTEMPSPAISESKPVDPDKIKKDKGGERGIETMFRNVMRTHVEFSGMADNKANIMISVNTLVLTAIIAVLSRKLDQNPHLIIPTAMITIVSLATLVIATIVTRPKITSGIFTKEDIEKKKANLLFFGNFFNMDLKNFEWGMKELMSDKDYLYGSMIKDFYYLGQVLGHKYKYLRVCYNIFMYGLIISVIAFAIAIVLYPETDLGPIY
ncbi:MAG TPA: Pycsar system effector family protein [Ignavibacteriaceae bacterium]|nr:Pycsar system effector family protein [Ignavibacteriaceae bacterium]